MAASTASISSIGNDVGHWEEAHFQEPGDGTQNQNLDHRHHEDEEAVIRERLLEENNQISRQQHVTEVAEKDPLEHHQSRRKTQSWLHDWWLLEVTGIALSLGATVAIIVILAYYNKRPLPNWKYGITLNAMLSVLSTISKTTMLFAVTECIGQAKWLLFRKRSESLTDFYSIDEASRGPWSAFRLLFRIRGRATLASLGALVLVLSLAVDPFTQQVLSYPLRSNLTSKYIPPTLPSVTNWTEPGDVTIGLASQLDGDLSSAVPFALRAAVYESIFSLGSSGSALSLNCPTGNCTFPLAETLGFCSICNDVTADITMDCNTGRAQGSSYPNSATNCTYQVPGKLNFGINSTNIQDDFSGATSEDPSDTMSTNMSVVALPRGQTLYSAGLTEDPGAEITVGPGGPAITTFQGIPDPLLAFGRVVFNNSFTPMPIIGGDVKPVATECALYWCVQTLNTSVQNGILNQTTTQIWFNNSAADTGYSSLSPPPRAGQAARDYQVNPLAKIPLAQFLEKTFTANMSAISLYGNTALQNAQLTEWSSDVAQALWNIEDLNGLMINLANRMTDALRNQFPDASHSPEGSVYLLQTYVHVSWPWLILPVVLVLASCILLSASVVANRGNRNVVWKNSSLAVLFHGLTANAHTRYLVGQKEMEEAAKGMNVHLREDAKDDLRLVSSPRASIEKNRSMRLSRLQGPKK